MPVDIATDLVLATTWIRHDLVSRHAAVTYAVRDGDLNADAQDWADSLQILFADRWKSVLDSNAQILHTSVVMGAGGGTFTTGDSTAAGTYGTMSGSTLPGNCAMLVKKRTAFGGRENRGRLYLPWMLLEGDVSEDGTWGGSAKTARQTVADNWLDDLNSGTDFWPVIANRVYDAPWDNPNRKLIEINEGKLITALQVQGVIATQRRRVVRS